MFHKEGYNIIIWSIIVLALLIFLIDITIEIEWIKKLLMIVFLFLFLMILQFFRDPKRKTILNDNHIIAPADGKIVVIEEVLENEFFNEKRRQISIFMSPFNVHVTRFPISGNIVYSKYHSGKYLVAWHPKSSEENERTTIVIENKTVGRVLYRQIAGAMARRIVNYAKINNHVLQGQDAGFIKFGSRIDIFLPLNMKLNISLNDKVIGGKTIIAQNSAIT
jgi:phosphatidylserine decarboxylase